MVAAGCLVSLARAQSPSRKVEIAAALSMTGDFEAFGRGNLEGIQLALEEAKASGAGPQIDLRIYDTTSDQERAKEIGRQVTASRAVLVLGPSFSVPSLAAYRKLSVPE